ncbi:MAG: hypothetical protein PHY54_10645 [Methylococcales bacterium]|nr:hypothetical protein [Methylococcales bacterium]
MDYTSILQELNKASLFDLHRLQSAIYQELLNPKRIEQIKARLKVGQTISYFDSKSNDLVDAVILKIQITRCLVRNIKDQKCWNLPFYYLNLDDVDTDIQPAKNNIGIPKSSLKVGTKVGFKNKYNNDIFGEVIRLNAKTATIRIGEHDEWLVPYRDLFYVIDGELGDLKEQTFIPHDL